MHPLIIKAFPTKFSKPVASLETWSPRFFLDEEGDATKRCLTLFGRLPNPHELAAICGSEIEKTEITAGIATGGLYLEYHNDTSDCVGACLIRRTPDSRLTLVNEHVRFLRRDGIEMKKFHWFSRQKAACQSLGISTIHITASRSSLSQGYYFYPFFGFNAPLPPEFYRYLANELTCCRTLLELYEHIQGRKTWYLYGEPCDMAFDLHKSNSQSQLYYEQYLKISSNCR